MSLTKQDLTDIRDVVLEALEVAVTPRLDALEARLDVLESEFTSFKSEMHTFRSDTNTFRSEMHTFRSEMNGFKSETNRRLSAIEAQLSNVDGRLTAIEDDVKELYKMIRQTPGLTFGSKAYQKLSNSKKIRVLEQEVTTLAKHMSVNPSH